jgi:hypothetical protein
MWLKWFPWKFILKYMARRHGLVDPLLILSYVRRFAQPSEVLEPMELVRAGMVMHTRGLINSRAIQHNLDWVWPWWVCRQFNPEDRSFVPRSFSLTHINLTCRNWTAVGIADCDPLPIVDPAGLLTPIWNGYSLDGWVIDDKGQMLTPSRIEKVRQTVSHENGTVVRTESEFNNMRLVNEARLELKEGRCICRMLLEGYSETGGMLAVAVRPYNPEGISFIHKIKPAQTARGWNVDGKSELYFDKEPDKCIFSDYHRGDAANLLQKAESSESVKCDVGMATAAALFRIEPGQTRQVCASVDVSADKPKTSKQWIRTYQEHDQHKIISRSAQMELPDAKYKFLYENAVNNIILHSPHVVYPGPFTYKRFWFRDAVFICNAMLSGGMPERVKRCIENFFSQQTAMGYFLSQEGEWDSNGQALWLIERFCRHTDSEIESHWTDPVIRGADWLIHKRVRSGKDVLHAGLLPAGFSAEHLGPNDFYYWDDFWAKAGLDAAAELMLKTGDKKRAEKYRKAADEMLGAIERTLFRAQERLGSNAMPASPYRRMDSGAVGSIIAGYPLQIWDPEDARLTETTEYLMEHFFVRGGFFQDMIHSGVNPYLTLHIAQQLLRANDCRYEQLCDTVAELASPTGNWPEAIHPQTGQGCMGDGHHIWAAAEWIMMVRNLFVYEERSRGKLVIAGGIRDGWLESGKTIEFGPTLTGCGAVTVRIETDSDKHVVSWRGNWYNSRPDIEVRLKQKVIAVQSDADCVTVERQ